MDYKKSKMSFLVRQKRYQMSVLTNNSLNIGSRMRPLQACSALEDLGGWKTIQNLFPLEDWQEKKGNMEQSLRKFTLILEILIPV